LHLILWTPLSSKRDKRGKFVTMNDSDDSLRDNDVPLLSKSTPVKRTYEFVYQNNKTLESYEQENDKMIFLLPLLHSNGKIKKWKTNLKSYYIITKLCELVIHLIICVMNTQLVEQHMDSWDDFLWYAVSGGSQ